MMITLERLELLSKSQMREFIRQRKLIAFSRIYYAGFFPLALISIHQSITKFYYQFFFFSVAVNSNGRITKAHELLVESMENRSTTAPC